MSLFAIRDDDTSFFTEPKELDSVYRSLWGHIPISLAVVPFTVASHPGVVFSTGASKEQTFSFGENGELVAYLQERLRQREVEIMMHGFTHQYQRTRLGWISEYVWKGEDQLYKETGIGKRYLEELLHTKIRIFVPPSNRIGKAGIRAVGVSNLHICYGSGKGVSHPWSLAYATADLKRWMFRFLRRRPYPFPVDLSTHKELASYELNPKNGTYKSLCDALEYCVNLSAPFVLATHYWQFKNHPDMLTDLFKLVDRALQLGAGPATVSESMGVL